MGYSEFTSEVPSYHVWERKYELFVSSSTHLLTNFFYRYFHPFWSPVWDLNLEPPTTPPQTFMLLHCPCWHACMAPAVLLGQIAFQSRARMDLREALDAGLLHFGLV